jgi:chromosome segregation ATPase
MEPNNSPPDALDALRIQAAAVAAQQAALTEEELRLQQRRSALEKQESQLAAHLDDRRRRLLEAQEQLKAERGSLEEERTALRGELGQEKENAARERQRFVDLRKRQKQRWLVHWRQQEAKVKQRQQELDAERERGRKQAEALERERATFEQGRLKINGELELRRCGLQEERHELSLEQQRWEATINVEHAERQRQEKALAAREAAVAEAERTLTEQKRQWEQGQDARRHESDGLEKRIRHLRSQLPPAADFVAEVARLPQSVHRGVGSLATSATGVEVPPTVWRLVGDLADQRWRLLEQWQLLLEVHSDWDRERGDVATALEATALQFIEREQHLVAQEGDLEARLAAAQRQQEALVQQRQRLDGWQARLTGEEAGWQSERAGLLVEIQAREESVVALTQQLQAVRQRRERRRRQELDALRTAQARCEEMRRQYAALWHDCQKRQAVMTQRERELASVRLALERYRVESLLRAPNPAAAEKRIEKLTQKAAERFAVVERDLAKQRDALSAEAKRLDGRAAQLQQWQDELDQRSQDLAHSEASEEGRRLEQTTADQHCHRQLRQLQLRRQHDERQLAALRDEIERVARFLLDDTPNEGESPLAA